MSIGSLPSNALSTAASLAARLTRVNKRPPKPTKRAHTPTRIQMEAVECGAAALAIVLEHYGLFVPLEEVRVACGVSRDGSRAKNILIAARQYGLKAQGFKRSIERLKTRKMPAIIFWNFNHFVVLEGFGKGKVFINDPARGPRVVTDEEFDESFTGVTLELEPGPMFKTGGAKPSLFTGLKTRLVGSRTALAFIILASLWVTLLGLIVPSFTRVFVDRILIEGLADWVAPLFGLMLGTVAMIGVLTALQQHFLLRTEVKLATASSAQFLWHVLKLPIDFFNQRRAADISVRVTINDRIAQLLSGEVATNLIRLLLIAFYVFVMAQYDVALTALGAIMAVVNIVALRTISRKRVDASQRLLTEQGKFTATSLNGLQTVETLKATGTESDFFSRWSGHQAQALSAEQDLSVYSELLSTIPPLLLTVTNALVLAVGGIRVIQGQLSMGELVAFQALVIAFLVPVNGLVFLGDRLQLTTGDMTRVDDVLRYPLATDAQSMSLAPAIQPPQPTQSARTVAKLKGYLEIRDLTFGYNRLDPPLVEGFSLSLRPGMRVALVGGSGSGKSTIAKLVAGVYEPWSGEILFDGNTRADIPRAELKHSLAMVDQDIYLLAGTIHDNITMWDETVPETNVIQAAKDAAIHQDIAKRLNGYYDQVLEGGANFSGGQRQRLEIARALVNDPSILVMDEATSALDPVTEKLIDENLRRRGCTCLIVAHRLSTIRDCDEIIVMERGKVVQRGTHERMIREDGPYARLIKMDEASGAKPKNVFDLIMQPSEPTPAKAPTKDMQL